MTIQSNPTPSLGTAFDDGIRIGSYYNTNYNRGLIGMSISPSMTYAIQPTANYNLYNAPVAAVGTLSLITPAPAGCAYVTYQGYPNTLQLDCYRGVSVTVSANVNHTIPVTTSGWDIWGHQLVETLTIPTNSTAVISGKKAFSYIHSVYVGATAGSILTYSTTEIFGFPYLVVDPSFALMYWNGAPLYEYNLTSGAGTFVPRNPLIRDMKIGDPQTPATATSGDVRGTFTPSFAPGNPNGSIWLMADIYVPGFEPLAGSLLAPNTVSPNLYNTYGVNQFNGGWL